MGEAEYTFLDICNKLPFNEIKGLIWRDKEKIIKNERRPFIDNLDELPFPAYEIFPLDKYVDKKRNQNSLTP